MRHLIIGNSAAGTAAAEAIRENQPNAQITMLTRDSAFYSRCQLHLVAAGVRSAAKTSFVPEDWAQRHGIEVRLGWDALAIDPLRKEVRCRNGEILPYDRLLLATGAGSLTPPIEGLQGSGVFGLRNLEDALGILRRMGESRQVVIIGAGLVGCELAETLAAGGHPSVSMVEMAPHPLPLQLEDTIGARLRDLMADHGMAMFCQDSVAAVERDGTGQPRAVVLKSGRTLPADLVVCAAGVRANTDLFAGLGTIGRRGILVDAGGRTSVPDIFAAGDVTESCDSTMGRVMPSAIWPAARRQGRVAGLNMSGGSTALEAHTGLKTSAVLCGTPLVSLGPIFEPDPTWRKEVFEHTDSRGRLCSKVCYTDPNDVLKAAILWGDISQAGLYAAAIVQQQPLGDLAIGSVPDYLLRAV